MNVLNAVGAAQAFLLSLFLFLKKEKQKSDMLLATFFLILSGLYFIQFVAENTTNQQLLYPILNISLLISPLFYHYVKALVINNGRLKINHYFPYILTSIILGIIFLFSPKEIALDYSVFVFTDRNIQGIVLKIIYLIELVYVPGYLVAIYMLLKKHNYNILNTYSYLEGINLNWIKLLFFVLFFTWGIAIFFPEVFPVSAILIFYVSYYGARQLQVAGNNTEDVVTEAGIIIENKPGLPESVKYLRSGLKEEDALIIKERITELLEKEKIYLESRLTINMISEKTGIRSNLISQVINDKFGKNFYDLINEYRVESFIREATGKEKGETTLFTIALECGFNSKASFNRIFKKLKGKSPTDYLEEYTVQQQI